VYNFFFDLDNMEATMDLEGTIPVGDETAGTSKEQSPAAHSHPADVKSRILEKIRRDMQRGDDPSMLTFDSGGGHSKYTSGG
jgi:hypothetical protein